jgi:hypothetical protein
LLSNPATSRTGDVGSILFSGANAFF